MTGSRLIIDDNNFEIHQGDSRLCGALPRKTAYGASNIASPMDGFTIDMQEWPDRIADLEREKASLKHLWESSGIGVLNQETYSYCHGFSAVMAVMLFRAAMNLPYVELSASSVAAPVTNFENAGAVIEDDLRQMVRVGVASTNFVPMLTCDKRMFQKGWETDAAEHAVTLWTECEPRNLKQEATWLLSCFPCCIGLNYWGHAVCDIGLVDLNPRLHWSNENRYGVEFLNSWSKNWGDGGFGIRAGTKKYADSIYVPRQLAVSTKLGKKRLQAV